MFLSHCAIDRSALVHCVYDELMRRAIVPWLDRNWGVMALMWCGRKSAETTLQSSQIAALALGPVPGFLRS